MSFFNPINFYYYDENHDENNDTTDDEHQDTFKKYVFENKKDAIQN